MTWRARLSPVARCGSAAHESRALPAASVARTKVPIRDASLGGYTAPMTFHKNCQSTTLSSMAITETKRINAFLEDVHAADLARIPMSMNDRNGERSDYLGAQGDIQFAITAKNLKHMHSSLDFDALDEDAQLSCRLSKYNAEQFSEGCKWRNQN